jgi:predicted nucleic acid-binding protein
VGECWVVNASPVITLAKAGYLDLLIEPSHQTLLPEAVAGEILGGPPSDAARQALENGWGTRLPVGVVPASVLEWSLGAGESAVIATALEQKSCHAVLDDAAARACARALGIPVLGTLGVVLRAKKQGRVASAGTVVRALRSCGLYLDDRIVRDALARTVGETWNP